VQTPRAAGRLVAAIASLLLVTPLLAGCSGGQGPTFDPSGPCTVDGQRPGAYPDLEARIPLTLDGKPPVRLDSGRNCTPTRLGSLGSHGITELRFAGGLWQTGSRSGTTIAVFSAPALTPDLLAEFYETSARAATKTENVERRTEAHEGASVIRIVTLNDQSFQTVAVPTTASLGLVPVVLVATDVRDVPDRADHEARVNAALDALKAAP
jgi:hypothetical protein